MPGANQETTKWTIWWDGTKPWRPQRSWRPALHMWDIFVSIRQNEEDASAIKYEEMLSVREMWVAAGTSWLGVCNLAWWTIKREVLRKSERWEMKESRRCQKCVPLRISLVKMSAGFNFLAMCSTSRVLSCTHLQIEFSRSSIWWAALEVMLCDHITQASLSLNRIVGELILEREWPLLETLRRRLWKSMIFVEVALVAPISASQELREVHSCHSPSQPMGPPFLNTIPPFMLQNLKRGRRVPSATAEPNFVNPNMHCCRQIMWRNLLEWVGWHPHMLQCWLKAGNRHMSAWEPRPLK